MKFDFLERSKSVNFNPSRQDIDLQLVDLKDGDDIDIYNQFNMTYYIYCFGVTTKGESIAFKINKIKPYFFIQCKNNLQWTTSIKNNFLAEVQKKKYSKISIGKGFLCKYTTKQEEKLQLLSEYLKIEKIDLTKFYKKPYFTEDSEFRNFGKLSKAYVINGDRVIVKMPTKNNFREIGIIKNSEFKFHGKVEEIKKFNSFWLKQLDLKVVNYDSFDGFNSVSNQNKSYLRINFKSKSCMNKLKDIFTYETFECNSKETFSLYESQVPPILRLFHDKDVKPANWLKLPRGKYTSIGMEEGLKGDRRTNCQYECEIDFDDIQEVEKNEIAPLLVASFDLECTSGDGSFPQPYRETDKIIQIGTTIHKYGVDEKEYRENVIFTLKGCDPIPNARVFCCETEQELIREWATFMIELDPDVLTGYNIFGFDFEYLYKRSLRFPSWEDNDKDNPSSFNKISKNPLLNMGRFRKRTTYKIKRLQSAALGQNSLKFIILPGRIVFDIYKYVQREFKLQLYKLNFVANKFLEGMRKDDVTPAQIFAFQEIDNKHRAIVAKYCIQDCWLCNKLVMKFCIIENTVGMANTCLVPMDFIFMRGQGIKALSLIAKGARKYGYLLPTLEKRREGTYKGAIVLTAKTGYHFKPVSCLDYSSLYPSCMISHNLCISSLVSKGTNPILYDKLDKSHMKQLKLPEKKRTRLIINENKKDVFLTCGENTYRIIEWDNDPTDAIPHEKYFYVQPKLDKDGRAIDDEKRALLPKILMKLLAQRAATRKELKLEKDPFKKSVMNGLQLSYKITANSIYGQLGAATSAFSMPCVAASVTAIGRCLLEIASDQCKNLFPGSTTVYGDTDSVFMSFKMDKNIDPMSEEALIKSIEMAQEADKYISKKFLTYPHRLEYEKTFQPYILFSKKRYVGKKYEFKTGRNDWKLSYTGIELKRRDNANILKIIYQDCLDFLLEGQKEESLKCLEKHLDNIIDNDKLKKYKINDFVLTKTLKSASSYKTGCEKDGCKVKTHYGKKKCSVCNSKLKFPTQGHVMLAEKVRLRDPGNAYQTNERIPYVFTATANRKKVLQGNRIETPEYIIKNRDTIIDYGYYIQQVENALLQLYGKQKDKKGKEIQLEEGEVNDNLILVKRIFKKAKDRAESENPFVIEAEKAKAKEKFKKQRAKDIEKAEKAEAKAEKARIRKEKADIVKAEKVEKARIRKEKSAKIKAEKAAVKAENARIRKEKAAKVKAAKASKASKAKAAKATKIKSTTNDLDEITTSLKKLKV